MFWSSGGGVEREHSKFRGRATKANYNSVSESDDEAAYKYGKSLASVSKLVSKNLDHACGVMSRLFRTRHRFRVCIGFVSPGPQEWGNRSQYAVAIETPCFLELEDGFGQILGVGRGPTESTFSRVAFLLHGSSEKAQGIGVLKLYTIIWFRRMADDQT